MVSSPRRPRLSPGRGRLYDYGHLLHRRRGARPWVLTGRQCGRGPDNEPLVDEVQPIASVDLSVVREAEALIDRPDGRWGTLDPMNGEG